MGRKSNLLATNETIKELVAAKRLLGKYDIRYFAIQKVYRISYKGCSWVVFRKADALKLVFDRIITELIQECNDEG